MQRSLGAAKCFYLFIYCSWHFKYVCKKHFLVVCMVLSHFLCHSMESKADIQTLTSSFIVVHIDSLQLQVTVTMVTAGGVDAMLIAYHLPKLK